MPKSSALTQSFDLTSLATAVVALVAGGLTLGCSSSDDPEIVKKPDEPTFTPGTMPCNINTGYAGDENCILAPDPAIGMQLHYGPKNYDDAAEVERYLLYPGEETTDCAFVKTANDKVVYFNHYHGRMRPGSHHMLLYVTGTLPAGRTEPFDSDGPQPCNQGLDTRNLFGAQTQKIDGNMDGKAPEYEGLAVKLEPSVQGVVQVHYINTGDKPILREGWANFIYTPESEVKILGDPIFFIGARINVPPGATQVITGMSASFDSLTAGMESPPEKVNLVAGTGHYHASTVRFTAWKVGSDGTRQLLIEDYDWHDPALMRFTSIATNPLPDPVGKTAGGYSGVVSLTRGDRIEWECEIVNKTDPPVTLTFGNEVYTKEMCNMFGMYAPTVGHAWRNDKF